MIRLVDEGLVFGLTRLVGGIVALHSRASGRSRVLDARSNSERGTAGSPYSGARGMWLTFCPVVASVCGGSSGFARDCRPLSNRGRADETTACTVSAAYRKWLEEGGEGDWSFQHAISRPSELGVGCRLPLSASRHSSTLLCRQGSGGCCLTKVVRIHQPMSPHEMSWSRVCSSSPWLFFHASRLMLRGPGGRRIHLRRRWLLSPALARCGRVVPCRIEVVSCGHRLWLCAVTFRCQPRIRTEAYLHAAVGEVGLRRGCRAGITFRLRPGLRGST